MIAKAKAICLRYYPFSNTSRLVQWLTADAGRIFTMIKGSQRTRSIFLGQYDVFYTCELVYHIRLNSAVRIARECVPLNLRPGLRTDWKACAVASYFCDLVTRITPLEAPHADLFPWLEPALDAAQQWGGSSALLCLCEMQMLSRLGLAPRLTRCVNCDSGLSASGELFFSTARGGVLCSRCRRRDDPYLIPLSSHAWSVLRAWQAAPWPPDQNPNAYTARVSQNIEARNEAEGLLGSFIVYHLEINPPSRAIALDVARRVIPGHSVNAKDGAPG